MGFEDDDEEEFSSMYKILSEQTGKKQQKLIVKELKTDKEKNVKQLKLSSFEECNSKYVELTGLVPIEKIFKKDDQDMIYIVTNQYQQYEFQEKLLSEDTLIEYFYQLIASLATLHDKGFVFPFDAILLENFYKLDDRVMFDVFSSLEEEIQPKVYFPPEFTSKQTNNTKEGNVYNLGLVFFLMSSQQKLDQIPLHVKNVDIKDFIQQKLDSDGFMFIQDVILCMLEDDASKRITAKDCESKLNKIRQRTKKKNSSLLSLRNYKDDRTSAQPRDFQEIASVEDTVDEIEEEEEETEEEKKKKNNRSKRHSISNLLRQKIGNIIESPNKTPSPSRSPVTPVDSQIYEKITTITESSERTTLENLPLLTQGMLKCYSGNLLSPWKSKYYYLSLDFLYDETGNKLTGKLSVKQVTSVLEDGKTGFKLQTKDKDFRFQCKSTVEKEEWMKAFNQILNPVVESEKKSIFEMFN